MAEPSNDAPELPSRRPRPSLGGRVTAVLAALALACAGAFGYLWWRAEDSRLGATEPESGSISSLADRDSALEAAPGLATRVLSYDWKTFDADLAAARASMRPTFREQYDATMARVRPRTLSQRIAVRASVVESSIVSAQENRAVALVFANSVTTAAGVHNRRIDQLRLQLTLTRGNDGWQVAELHEL